MYADPLQLTGNSTGGTNDALDFVRTAMSGTNSTWVASNPTAGYRVSLDVRHTKPSKPKGASYPIYRSNLLLRLEKYNSTNEIWDGTTCSLTLTSPGLNGPLATTDIEDAWSLIKSFMTTAKMTSLVRQEV